MKTRRFKKNNPRWPRKYYAGLTAKQAATRRKEILKYGALPSSNRRAYVGFKTDRGVTRILGQTDYLCESFNMVGSSVFRPRKLVANSNFASLIDNNGNLVGTFNNWKNYSKSMNVLDSSNGWTHSFVVLGTTKRLPVSWMPRLTVTTNP